MDSDFILRILGKEYPKDKYAFFEELRIGGGFSKDSEQRFDAYSICYFPSKRNVTSCFEIKISRNDYLSEMKKPKKRRAGLRLANEFYFVTPEGLLEVTEVPVECGLMEVTESGHIKTIIHAPFRDVEPPTWLFTASIARRAMVQEGTPELEKMYWKNLAIEVKTEVHKILNKNHFEWSAKNNELVAKIIEEISRDVANIDVQQMIRERG